VAAQLAERGVEIRGCETTREYVPAAKPATEADYATEFLGPTISVKVVGSLDEAARHINRYGSHHTDAIVTAICMRRRFVARVDSAAVMVNASTRSTTAANSGSAEIGISTDKFHVQALQIEELTSYKYVVYGEGHVRG
jgi:glutamate-5-semialdehyde dehydrogenase